MGMFRRKKPADDTPVPATPMQWRRMFAMLKPHRITLTIGVVASVISAGLGLVFPAFVQGVLDSVLQEGNFALLDSITFALVVIFLFRSVAEFAESYFLNYVGERIVTTLRSDLYAHMQTLSLDFFVTRRVGELLSRMNSDVTMMRNVLTNTVAELLEQSLAIVGAITIMVVINWRMTLFIILMLPVIMAIGAVFGLYLRRISTEVQDEIAVAGVVSEEVLQNIREVKSFARESYEIQRYDNAIQRAFKAAVRLLRVRASFGAVIAFIAFAGLSLILWFGGREVLEGRLTGGQLIAFLIYGLTVAGGFAILIGLYSSFQEAIGATKRVFELLDTAPSLKDAPNAVPLPRVRGRVTFEDVRFSYDERQEVLKGITLEVAEGEILALVGPSGAGKSTIFNLIPRFYDPTQGALKVDGYDLREVTMHSLRAQVGIVPQETMLFGGTIRENILYGRLDASEAELYEAARAANAHEFIMGLPDGYETIVGERGVRLSGGQRQRVAIARAILKDPRILLLDEATSSLDNESEHLVQEALARLMQGRTTIIIAHRLSTVRVAHRIAVLDSGQVVELGTHDELMAQNGLYAKLYDMQFRIMDESTVTP